MPKALDQRAAAPSEKEGVARERISLEMLLHQKRQTGHTLAHVRVAGGDPDLHPAWDGYHRSAFNVAATRAAGAVALIITVAPNANLTAMAVSGDLFRPHEEASSAITAGTKAGPDRAAS
jgi:hypothetical protein